MSAKRTGKLEPKSKVWLERAGRPVFGDGKARLLEQIDRSGSLAAAAQALGMSYRGLWGRLREMESRLGFKLVARTAGGPGGGGSRLTERGRDLLARYRRFRRGINAHVDGRFEKAFADWR
jgi:molybdate transport system regulatory protein